MLGNVFLDSHRVAFSTKNQPLIHTSFDQIKVQYMLKKQKFIKRRRQLFNKVLTDAVLIIIKQVS